MADKPDIMRWLRPSNIEWLQACPGAALLCESLKLDKSESAPSAAGTACHRAIAKAVQLLAGTGFQNRAYAIERAEALLVELGYEREVWKLKRAWQKFLLLLQTLGGVPAIQGCHVECKLPMHALGLDDRHGTADVVLVLADRVVVIDWKFGYGDVTDADRNPQIAAYAAAAAELFHRHHALTYVIQPALTDLEQVSCGEFSDGALTLTRGYCQIVSGRAQEPDPTLSVNYSCQHCPALGRCPAAKEYIVRVQEALTSIAETTPAKRSMVVADAKLAEKWAERVQDEAKAELAKDSAAIPGWALKSSGSAQSIDARQAFDIAKDDTELMNAVIGAARVSVPALNEAGVLERFKLIVQSQPKAPSLRQVKEKA